MLILGIVIGLLIAILIVVTMIFFKNPIQKSVKIVEKRIELKGPRPRGFVFESESDEQKARDKIIEENRELGKDTPLSDLSSE